MRRHVLLAALLLLACATLCVSALDARQLRGVRPKGQPSTAAVAACAVLCSPCLCFFAPLSLMICDPNSPNVAMLSDVSCRHTHRRLTNVLSDPTRPPLFCRLTVPDFPTARPCANACLLLCDLLSHIRPPDVERYSGSTFQCLNGIGTVPAAQVNGQ
jgi:hypothetical protein